MKSNFSLIDFIKSTFYLVAISFVFVSGLPSIFLISFSLNLICYSVGILIASIEIRRKKPAKQALFEAPLHPSRLVFTHILRLGRVGFALRIVVLVPRMVWELWPPPCQGGFRTDSARRHRGDD